MLWSGLLILSFVGCGWISNQTGDGSADSTVTTTDGEMLFWLSTSMMISLTLFHKNHHSQEQGY